MPDVECTHAFASTVYCFGPQKQHLSLHTQVMPLVKIKATVRRMHDFQLQKEIHEVLADPNLTLIQWVPDVFQVQQLLLLRPGSTESMLSATR